ECNCRRQRKSRPCRQRTEITCARQADRYSYFAACRPWEELRNRNEVRVGLLLQPVAANDELIAKIAEVRNRPPETGQSELAENREYFHRSANLPLRGVGHLSDMRVHRKLYDARRIAHRAPYSPLTLAKIILVPGDLARAGPAMARPCGLIPLTW